MQDEKYTCNCFHQQEDREGRDAFDLLDELEEKLNIKVRPLSWPIGIETFQGVYNMHRGELNLFEGNKPNIAKENVKIDDLSSNQLDDFIGAESAAELREEADW